ncbi:unnamed protein product, partial [Effrenium voratum]
TACICLSAAVAKEISPDFLALPLPQGQGRHVYVGVGATPNDMSWIQQQEKHLDVRFLPVMVQPHPAWALQLRQIAEDTGGAFYPNVAWIRDGMRMRLNVASHPIFKTGLDSVFHVRGRHDT